MRAEVEDVVLGMESAVLPRARVAGDEGADEKGDGDGEVEAEEVDRCLAFRESIVVMSPFFLRFLYHGRLFPF